MLTAILSFVGGLCQSVAGFGSAIVIMTILPHFFPIGTAAGIVTLICCPLGALISYRYRSSIRLNQILLPILSYSISCYLAVKFTPNADLNMLKAILGCLFVILAVFFFFFSDWISIKPTAVSAIVFCTLAGVSGGFFAIGGPMLVVYFSAATNAKEEYMGCVNATLLLTNIVQTIQRLHSGILSIDVIPSVFAGILGIIAGFMLGSRIIDRVNQQLLKKLIYVFLAIAGVLTFVSAVSGA